MVETISMVEDTLNKIFQNEIKHHSSRELLSEAEYLKFELAEKNKHTTAHFKSLTKRAEIVLNEIARRKRLCETHPWLSLPGKGFATIELIQEIKAKADIVAVFSDILGVFLEPQAHKRWKYICPIHHDTNPSGVVYEDERRWWCFGCDVGGDVFDALMVFRRFTFVQAVKELATFTMVKLPQKRKGIET